MAALTQTSRRCLEWIDWQRAIKIASRDEHDANPTHNRNRRGRGRGGRKREGRIWKESEEMRGESRLMVWRWAHTNIVKIGTILASENPGVAENPWMSRRILIGVSGCRQASPRIPKWFKESPRISKNLQASHSGVDHLEASLSIPIYFRASLSIPKCFKESETSERIPKYLKESPNISKNP